MQLNPAFTPSSPTFTGVEWSCEGTFASVDNSGRVYGLRSGLSSVTVVTLDGDKTASCSFTVLPLPMNKDKTYFKTTSSTIDCSQPYNVKSNLTIEPALASVSITWSSSNTRIATVDQDGVVTGHYVGEAVITAVVSDQSGQSKTLSFTVYTQPYISSISVDNSSGIIAGASGVDNILTIKGEGFGDSRNNGYVKFSNSKGESLRIIDLDIFDYGTSDNWSNTLIKMKLPNGISNKGKDLFELGTGDILIMVFDNKGDPNTSGTKKLTIPYAYTQYSDETGTKKWRTSISDYRSVKDTLYHPGIAFSLDTSVTNHPDYKAMRRVILRALADWSCKIGLNITLDQNSKNIIDVCSINDGVLMQQRDFGKLHNFSTASYNYRYYETKGIRISRSVKFDYNLPDTTISSDKYDFYSLFMHEMGHVLGLAHLNNISDNLMYYSIGKGKRRLMEDNAAIITEATKMVSFSSKLQNTYKSQLLTLIASTGCNPPNPPTLKKLKAISPWSFHAEWTYDPAVIDEIAPPKFRIEYKKSSSTFDFNIAKDEISTDMRLDTLKWKTESNTQYLVRVVSYNEYNSNESNVLSILTPEEETPPVPSIVSATINSNGGVEIKWDPEETQTLYYQVYRRSSTGVGTNANKYKIDARYTTCKYVDYPPLDEAYVYQIIACNQYNCTSSDNYVYVIPTPCSSPSYANYEYNTQLNSPLHYAYATDWLEFGNSILIKTAKTLIAEAANRVRFSPGFSAAKGSFVHASTASCYGTKSYNEVADSSIVVENTNNEDSVSYVSPVNDLESLSYNVFPNPTRNTLKIKTDIEMSNVIVTNSIGNVIFEQKRNQHSCDINFETLPSGTYYLHVKFIDNSTKNSIIIKQ